MTKREAKDAHKPGALEAIEEQTRGRSELAPRPTCRTCAYWRSDEEQRNGDCTHDLPQIVESAGHHAGYFPRMDHHRSCGLHPDMSAWIKTEWPKVKR